jgi:hypothetical protein
MSDQDFEYYTRREQHERARAERSRDQTARHVHLAMAERYAERLRAMMPPAPAPEPA